MNNIDVRIALTKASMKQWELADRMGITEFTLSRKLRKELPEAEKSKIMTLIQENKKDKKAVSEAW